eukprot:11193647-Lingulodinium_polyedra.AAC.1
MAHLRPSAKTARWPARGCRCAARSRAAVRRELLVDEPCETAQQRPARLERWRWRAHPTQQEPRPE